MKGESEMEIKTYKDGVATVYEYWSEEDYKKPVPCPTYRCYRYEPQKESADKTEKDIFNEMIRKFEEIGNIRFSGYTRPLITVEDAISVIRSVSEQYRKEFRGKE